MQASPPLPPLDALEFFSGIGGFRCALDASRLGGGGRARVLQAFDLNPLANLVYEANFHERPSTRNLESVPAELLDQYHAPLWLLSPPCQPYTRNGCGRDVDDPRARPLLHLLDLLPTLRHPPDFLMLENVAPFAQSQSRERLVAALRRGGLVCRELLASPADIGVPNSRLRYFLLARREPFAQAGASSEQAASVALRWLPEEGPAPGRCEPLARYLDRGLSPEAVEALRVPPAVVLRSGRLFDVVTPWSRRSCCFTKAYGRYVESTGSVLATALPEPAATDPPSDEAAIPAGATPAQMATWGLRYLGPLEIARLHGFPECFVFPAQVSRRSRYQLLGNSLNVTLVARLVDHLLSAPAPPSPPPAAARVG